MASSCMDRNLEKANVTADVNAPARPGDVAIVEEFEKAQALNTIKAYDLFIRRHPEHRLTPRAREAISNLRKSKGAK